MPRQLMKITGTANYRKSQKKAQFPLLPGDAASIRQIESQREAAKANKMVTEPLEYTGPLTDFSPIKNSKSNSDITAAIHAILNNMWTDYPLKANGLYAVGPKLRSETEEFRNGCPPIVTVNQLYGVFPTLTTHVDRAISQLFSKGQVRFVQVSSTDTSRDIVIRAEDFYPICDNISVQLGQLSRDRPDATWFSATELLKYEVDISECVSKGMLTIDPGRKGVHTLALPNQGRVSKLSRQTRAWLLQTMVQCNRKFKELPESQIMDKSHASKKYWTQFHGVNLEWLLYDLVGGGWIDGFSTPIGRGWKVLRK